MSVEPAGSSAELQRAVERLTQSINSLEAKVVLQVVYAADKEAAQERHSNVSRRMDDIEKAAREDNERLEKKVDADINDRKADRRLIVAAFLALVAQIILQIYQQAQGGG